MYKLVYKGDFVEGFDEDQIIGNLAQLLQLKPKVVRLMFFSGRPSVIKLLDNTTEVERWRAAFVDAGVRLHSVSLDAPDVGNIADQIELDLELHELEVDDEDDLPQFLVRREPQPEPEQEPSGSIFTPVPLTPPVPVQHPVAKVQPPATTSDQPAPAPAPAPAPNASSGEPVVTPVLETLASAPGDNTELRDEFDYDDDDWIKKQKWLAESEEEVEPPPTAEEAAELERAIHRHKASFLWGMLVILLAISITAGTILWLKRPLWTPVAASEQASQLASALASPSLFGLAYLHVERMHRVKDDQPRTLAHLPGPEKEFWARMEAAGIDLGKQTREAWVGFYGQQQRLQPLWILEGQFQPVVIKAWLQQHYQIEADTPQGIIFSGVDIQHCERTPVKSAYISEQRLVIGAPEFVAMFNGRLESQARAEKDLSGWQDWSKDKMLAAALFHPGNSPERTTAMALSRLSIDAAPISAIYAGLEPRLFPPAVEFSSALASSDAQAIQAIRQQLSNSLQQARHTLAVDWPETLPLYERLSVGGDESHVAINALFDEQVQQEIQQWISSLLGKAFSPLGLTMEVAQERVDESPLLFADVPATPLADFASVKHFNQSFVPQVETGPFGLAISSLEQTDNGALLNLDVAAFNLPNLGRETDSVSLRITDIADAYGNSLLATTDCATQSLRQATPINLIYQGNVFDQGQPVGFVGLQGGKKILLPPTLDLTRAGLIKGVIEHRLPTRIERLSLAQPLAGQKIDAQGVSVRFLSAGPSQLHFQVAGNTAALLHVNALNEAGKVLASNSALRGSNLLDQGKTVTIDFQGKVAAVELILVREQVLQTHEFTLAGIYPPVRDFSMVLPPPEVFSAEQLPALEKDTAPAVSFPHQAPANSVIAGPVLIAVHELLAQPQNTLALRADIYTRNSHPLSRQLGAVSMVISELEDGSGNLHSVHYQSPIAMDHQGGYWLNGNYQTDPTQPWLRGLLEMRAGDLPVGDTVALWGKLVFSAAQEPVPIQLPFRFGMQWNANDALLKLQRVESGRLIFDMEGNLPSLMAIRALSLDGELVSQPAQLRTVFGKHRIELDIKQIPATIEFQTARELTTLEVPVELRVNP